MARGEDAHVLEVNEGVVAVLPARCEAARSTHLPAGAARVVVSSGVKLEGPDLTRSLTQGEGVIIREPIRCLSGARSIAHETAPDISGAPGWPMLRLEAPLVCQARAGEQEPRNGPAASPHHAGCGGDELRLEQWRQAQLRSEKTARQKHRGSGRRALRRAVAAETRVVFQARETAI